MSELLNKLQNTGLIVTENVATINLRSNNMSAVVMVGEELIRIDNVNGRLILNYSNTDYELHEGGIYEGDSQIPMR